MLSSGREREVEPPFGEVLRRERRAAALSQQELAERAGLTVNGIGQLERGVRTRPYPHTVRALADALGLAGDDRRLFLDAAPARRTRQAHASPAAPAPVAPAPITLVGRDAELAHVLASVRPGRLLTLTGPGGVGKTSLALAATAEVVTAGTAIVTFVPLDAIDDTEDALLAVGQRLGLHDGGPSGIREQLRTILVDGPRLLVLDNLEQLPSLTTEIASLLADLPQLALLATSRGPLRLRAELEVPVPPLPVDDAVALLLQRASRVPAHLEPGRLDAATVDALRAICARVDGLPLAIELAASWLRTLPPPDLAAQLEDALPLLVDGPSDLPARHRELRETIRWSEQLLDDEHRTVFRALSTLPAEWDLATAAAVADRPEVDTLRAVALLVERSLVVRAAADLDGRARFRMLRTVRAFGHEQLATCGDPDGPRERLAEVVLELVEHIGDGSHGPDQAEWLARAEERLSDVRATLRWAVNTGRYELAARVYHGLFWTWYVGHATEGVRWGRALVETPHTLNDGLLARVEATWALAILAGGDQRESLDAARRATVRAEAAGDPEGLAKALAVAANAAANLGESSVLQAAAERTARLEEGLPFASVARATVRIAEARHAMAAADAGAAGELLARADAEVTRAGVPWLRALWLNVAVGADLLSGQGRHTVTRLERALQISTSLGDAPATLYTVTLLAVDAARRGAPEDAARALGAAETHGRRTGQRIYDPGTARLVATLRVGLEQQLGAAPLATLLAEGGELSPGEVLAAARRTTSTPA